MKRHLEIIHLRLTSDRPSGFAREILKSVVALKAQVEIRIYYHTTLLTDLGIHLYLETETKDPRVLELGVRLASALKEYGLVEHSVWIEQE